MSIGRWRRVASVVATAAGSSPRQRGGYTSRVVAPTIVIPIPPQRERDPAGAVGSHKVNCVRSFAVFAAQDDKFLGRAPFELSSRIPQRERDPRARESPIHRSTCEISAHHVAQRATATEIRGVSRDPLFDQEVSEYFVE